MAPSDTITVGTVSKVSVASFLSNRKKSDEIIEMVMLMNSKTSANESAKRMKRLKSIEDGAKAISATNVHLMADSIVSVQVSMILQALFDPLITSVDDLQEVAETEVASDIFVTNLRTADPVVFGSLTTPTVTSTVSTTVLSTDRPTRQPTVFSTPVNPYKSKNVLIVGLVCGLCGAVILLVVIGLNYFNERANTTSKSYWITITSVLTVFMSILTVGLVSGWAKNPNYYESTIGFLGQPDWKSNIFDMMGNAKAAPPPRISGSIH